MKIATKTCMRHTAHRSTRRLPAKFISFLLCAGLAATAASGKSGRTDGGDERFAEGGTFAGFRPDQEVVSLRTRNAKHFRNADGTFTAQTGGVYHYRDANGLWQDIDLTLQPSARGFANETNELKSYFPQRPGTGGVEMAINGQVRFSWWQRPQLTFTDNGRVLGHHEAAPAVGLTYKNTLQYDQAYDQISEEFVALRNGIENNTIIHALSREIAGLPAGAMLEFRQFIPLQSGWTVDVNGVRQTGRFSANAFHISIPRTESGIYFSPVVVFDQGISREEALYTCYAPAEKLTTRDLQQKAAHVLQTTYEGRLVNGGLELVTRMPADWLKTAGRAFPVTIDPTVTITPTSSSGSYYAPISHWYGFQRHADLYLASEIGVSNINITAIEYNRTSTSGTNNAKPAKVYMRTTTASTLTGTSAWNSTTYTGGLTPLYDATADLHGTTAGFKMITFAAPFLYTGNNLLVMVYDAYGGSGSTKYINESSSPANRQAYKRQDTNDPGDATATAVESYLPEIRITYTAATNVPPVCVSSPAAPANNSTTVCAGTTQLRWNKVTGATGYDVYLNAGTASPTTVVSANQADTFYNATTVAGAYKWRIVPKNTYGPATGCSDFSFTVQANATPAVSITISPNDTFCANVRTTFTATPVEGGATPTYQWKVNGANVGSSSATYSTTALANKDSVMVVMTSGSTGCLTSNTANSNNIVVTVLPVPATTLSAGGPIAFCSGRSVNLRATSNAQNLQWLNNGAPIAAATAATYTASISGRYAVQATGANGCSSISDTIQVTVFSNPFPQVNRLGNVLSTATYYSSYQWYRNGQLIPGATAYQYTVARDGGYTVRVGDTTACSGTSAVVPVNSLAVGNTAAGTGPSVYPNPANGIVYINAAEPVSVIVRSIDGKEVMAASDVNSVDVTRLAGGVYQLYILDKHRQLLKVEKLVRTAD